MPSKATGVCLRNLFGFASGCYVTNNCIFALQVSLLAPWIAVAVLLAGGTGWYALRRRRARSWDSGWIELEGGPPVDLPSLFRCRPCKSPAAFLYHVQTHVVAGIIVVILLVWAYL